MSIFISFEYVNLCQKWYYTSIKHYWQSWTYDWLKVMSLRLVREVLCLNSWFWLFCIFRWELLWVSNSHMVVKRKRLSNSQFTSSTKPKCVHYVYIHVWVLVYMIDCVQYGDRKIYNDLYVINKCGHLPIHPLAVLLILQRAGAESSWPDNLCTKLRKYVYYLTQLTWNCWSGRGIPMIPH